MDKEYVFIVNKQVPFGEVISKLQQFHQQNRYKSFVIDTEEKGDTRTLLIQVNELILHYQDLLFFYEFGKSLSEMMDSGVQQSYL